MALISVNGQAAIEARLTMPRIGAWHLDVLVDDPDQLAGAATVNVNDGALVLNGTVVRSGVFADTGHVRIVAGAGGLPGGISPPPKHYVGTSVRVALGDVLAALGERLAPTSDQTVLSAGLLAFTAAACPVGTTISLLLAAAAPLPPTPSWRVLPDGSVWVGRETWPDAGLDPATYQIYEDNAEQNSMLIGLDAPVALVGTIFEGRLVSATEARVARDGGVEMRVWFEDGAPVMRDRLRKAFGSLVEKAAARADRIDYGRLYPATIINQTGRMVDVQPDQIGGRDLLPDMANVPLWLGLPGATIDDTVGGRAMIGWLGGDPSKPVAIAFDAETTLPDGKATLAIAGGTAGAARTGDSTKLTLSPADVAALVASIAAMNVFTPSGSPPGTATPVVFEGGQITSGSAIVKIGG